MNHDAYYMSRAISLAKNQQGRTGENPAVGCVILDRRGNKLAEAATGDGGRPHAEEIALSRLTLEDTRGGTAYVTLEPCRQRSSDTPSCSDRLIQAKIKHVIIATLDPHPLGKGGKDALIEAGLRVEDGLMKADADALYADFFAAVAQQS